MSRVKVLTQPPVKSKTACLSKKTSKNIKCYSLLDTNEVLEREDTTGSDLPARRRLDLERLNRECGRGSLSND